MRSCKDGLFTVGDAGNHNPTPLETEDKWHLKLSGDLKNPRIFSLPELWQLPQTEIDIPIECVSAGKLCGKGETANFKGVLFRTIAQEAKPLPSVQSVMFISKAPGTCGPKRERHCTSLELEYCLNNDLILTNTLHGKPLPYKNGWPLRSVVPPNRYFYKSIKWLEEIRFLSQPLKECRGTWESYAGYHNIARVELQERFEPFVRKISGLDQDNVDILEEIPTSQWPMELQKMYDSRDFSRLVMAKVNLFDVLQLKHLDFSHCKFSDALYRSKIRGVNFKQGIFHNASMQHGNFSLSLFTSAKFSNAGDSPADLSYGDFEGAKFMNADLRNVSMQGAILTGTQFYSPKEIEGSRARKSAQVQGLLIKDSVGLDSTQYQWLLEDGALG